MKIDDDYLAQNKALWNQWASAHVASDFYGVPSFLAGRNSLTEIERQLLGDINGKTVLHLQCHFGQDTISLSRLGAVATGIDLSDTAIEEAKRLAQSAGADTRFIASDVYSLPDHLDERFDLVFTSFGTIGWLPDIDRWAAVVSHFLKPGGAFVFAEFHPFMWIWDQDFKHIIYRYFQSDMIVEEEKGSYAAEEGEVMHSMTWNHGLGEVVTALLKQGLQLETFQEYDYSPHNCFKHTEEVSPGKFRIKHMKDHIPMVYGIRAKSPMKKH
jgi:ubiquinone/menaquinone biosynthesis C-methylase UbiE